MNTSSQELENYIEAFNSKVERVIELREALEQCEEYFEGLCDTVDGPYGEPAPNEEMRMLSMVRAALEGAGR